MSSHPTTRHARQVVVAEPFSGRVPSADYADAFEMDRMVTDMRTPEQWARDGFGGLSRSSRESGMRVHRLLLGFRLGPFSDADHIFGWTVSERRADLVRLETTGYLMSGYMVWRLSPGLATFTTFLKYRRPTLAALVWRYAGRVHRRGAPRLLELAAKTGASVHCRLTDE